jgi:BirA family transcriptional regulator, biotin operon repressor / biotin---[acetyl-CoA-carboxylase] ligase
VLRLLADGEFHSGEEIGRLLGVTRESISNALADVEAFGLTVYRVRGRGYRLVTPVRWLDAGGIRQRLGAQADAFTIEVIDQTGSTNDDLIARVPQGAPSGLVRIAELQTHGRGRRGRVWHTGLGGALTFSVLWRFEQGAGFLSGLALAVGVALMRALHRAGARDVALKWPNDLLWRHCKLGGILIELSGDVMGPSAAVIGVGINVRLPQDVIDRIDQPVTDLYRIGIDADRNALIADILAELGRVLADFSREGFAPLRDEWQRAHAYHDKMVALRMPDNTRIEGRVRGVHEDGALLLEQRSGVRKYYGGELSLRPVKP